MRISNSTKGYLAVVTGAVLWASSGATGKALFNQGMNPLELVQIRATLSSLILFLIILPIKRDLLKIKKQDIVLFFLLGGVAMTSVQIFYFYAISKIEVAAAILLEYLAPVFVLAFSVLFWKERLTASKIIALMLALTGCWIMVGGYDFNLLRLNFLGVAAGLASAVSFAAYTLLGHRGLKDYHPITVLFYALAFSALTMHLVYPPFHYLKIPFTNTEMLAVLYISLPGTIIPFGLFFYGVHLIGSTNASITASMEPISAGFIAYLFLGERLEYPQIGGGIMVIAAVALLSYFGKGKKSGPDPI